MGYHKHSAIIVTSWDTHNWRDDTHPGNMQRAYDSIRKRIAEIDENFLTCLTPLQEGVCNGYQSFAFLPDGSKEGWDDSDTGDEIRTAICDYLDSIWGNAGYIQYIEVQFEGDDSVVSYRTTKRRDE